MRVDRDRFLEEGYLVVREVVPPDQLDEVRAAYEILVERQRETWASQRKPDDPPGGAWETSAQPRLALNRELGDAIDERSAAAVEVWLGERAQGVSEQLLAVDEALSRLAQEDPTAADVVKLRYFGAMSVQEAAEVLGIHRATAYRHWAYARAWIRADVQSTDTSDK